MAQNITVEAQKRTVNGKKVKTLRKQGILPANVFGKGINSQAIQINQHDFLKAYKTAGETHLVEVKVGSDTFHTLIHQVQSNPVTDEPFHVDFQAVSLKERTKAVVPINLVGESPAEKEGIGILVQQLSEVEVEALPTDLPDRLEADVSILAQVNATLFVKDLKVDSTKVAIASEDLEKIVAKVEPPAKEEVVTPPPAAEVAPVEGEAPAATPAEGSAAPVEEEKK